MNNEAPSFDYKKTTNLSDISFENESAAIPTFAKKLWVAEAKVGLNDCSTGSTRVLCANKNGADNGFTWGASIKKGGLSAASTDVDADRDILTPQFKNLRSKATEHSVFISVEDDAAVVKK